MLKKFNINKLRKDSEELKETKDELSRKRQENLGIKARLSSDFNK